MLFEMLRETTLPRLQILVERFDSASGLQAPHPVKAGVPFSLSRCHLHSSDTTFQDHRALGDPTSGSLPRDPTRDLASQREPSNRLFVPAARGQGLAVSAGNL